MSLGSVNLDEIDILKIGHEQQNVVRAKNVFETPARIIETAGAARFARINPHYPGVRAAIDPDLLDALCGALGAVAGKAFGIDATRWIGEAWYSLVTLAPDKITPVQRLPHFDGFDPQQLAVMIYLNQSGHGGTSFYRHKSTGFEAVTEQRYPQYKTHLEADIGASGLPPAAYIQDGAPVFERIADFAPEFNSLIFYRGIALHSGSIRNDLPLSSDPMTGRLTINGFFRPER